MDKRDEAALANAMLLGDLQVFSSSYDSLLFYRFTSDYGSGGWFVSKLGAAWAFLAALGLGIEPNGTELTKLGNH